MKLFLAIACAVGITLLVACGDDDDSSSDARATQVGALSENAVDAWVATGPGGLFSFLHQDVAANCSADALEEAMSDQPQPTAWRNTRDIVVTEDVATATVIIVADGQDIEQAWTFELEQGVRWRVTGFPGIEECTS